jgi:class 3 adenylate cyclase/pimeloyl-ACP methyl ester carboxylesterase
VKSPRTRYAKTDDGVYIAYQVVGDGPVDLVWQFDYFGNVDAVWEHPLWAHFLGGFTEFSRLILLDRRGTGQSSRNVPPSDLETRASDLRAVLDALGIDDVVAGGHGQGGAASALFAATEPSRVRSFVWDNPQARTLWAPDYPWGVNSEYLERARRVTEEYWGTDALFAILGELDDYVVPTEATIGYGKLSRSTATPDVALEIDRIWNETDIRGVLPAVRAPALLTELDSGDRGQIDYIASLMPNAQVVRVPGENGYQPEVIDRTHDAIRTFLGLAPPPSRGGRVLATVLFTDIVGSTERAAELGDERWKDLLADHHARTRGELARHRGREIDTTGDGFLATFDGPARAVRCAQAIQSSVREIGLEVRAGVHTGEVELVGAGVQGLAVHVGARVGALAGPSEVLVSSTVKDLTAGSGLNFEDAGEHELKGVPDPWHLYRVVSEP